MTDFIKNQLLKIENRLFIGRILSYSIGYLFITLWLNHIRTTSSLWFVWVLIIVQFALYFSIFITGYKRSKVLGVSESLSLGVFVVLAILGRVNDWELIVIPLTLIGTILFSLKHNEIWKK